MRRRGKVTVNAGIQSWTVPATGTYRVEAWGAEGGTQLCVDSGLGGFGGGGNGGNGGPGGGGYEGGLAGGSGNAGLAHGLGGKSYSVGAANKVQEDGIKTGDGQVKITKL